MTFYDDSGAVMGLQTASANVQYGIQGQQAPELNLETWIDGDGERVDPIYLSDYRGKVIYLYFFQDWWPGCQRVGFPTLKQLTETFKNTDQVKFLAVQTVFEGYNFNSQAKLRKNQLKYDVKIPMAHAPGNRQTHEVPSVMKNYRSGGTPWAVIIDKKGEVIFNNFHIELPQAVALIERLMSKGGWQITEDRG